MKLMLTSFGVGQEELREPDEEIRFNYEDRPSPFWRMPPVRLRDVNNRFMPEYAALLLCEKVVLDETSFALLQEGRHRVYAEVAKALTALHAEGFVELVDFNRILSDKQALLQRMLEHDLAALDQWISPLEQSLRLWHRFAEHAAKLISQERRYLDRNHIPPLVMMGRSPAGSGAAIIANLLLSDALEFSRKRRRSEHRDALRDRLRLYLSYVNANLVLSNELEVGFHDWTDFAPFYRQKFLSVGKEEVETEKHISAAQALFKVSFPEFAIADTPGLLRALQDKRVADLRQLVDDAVKGEVAFDEEFARHVLGDVLRIEKRVARYRHIVSYLTLPVNFLPWVGGLAQKVAEEAIGMVLERQLKRQYRWFYMLSDVAEGATGE